MKRFVMFLALFAVLLGILLLLVALLLNTFEASREEQLARLNTLATRLTPFPESSEIVHLEGTRRSTSTDAFGCSTLYTATLWQTAAIDFAAIRDHYAAQFAVLDWVEIIRAETYSAYAIDEESAIRIEFEPDELPTEDHGEGDWAALTADHLLGAGTVLVMLEHASPCVIEIDALRATLERDSAVD